jgi:hypothetical protein
VWAYVAAVIGAMGQGVLSDVWWWTQLSTSAFVLLVIALLTWSYRLEPHPFAIVLRRFCIVGISTWVLLTVALAAATQAPGVQNNIATIGSMIWYVFLGSLLLLVPSPVEVAADHARVLAARGHQHGGHFVDCCSSPSSSSGSSPR